MSVTFSTIKPGLRLADQVASALEQEIRAGRLAEGERLPTEVALVQQFGVSRTVVREAVSRLKSSGLVDARQGSGMYVRRPGFEPLHFDPMSAASKEAVLQIVEVRRALEAEVAELAAQRRTEEDMTRIRTALAAIDAAVAGGRDGVEEDVQFHRVIAEAARNPFLMRTLDYLSQFLRSATRVTRANEARHAPFAADVLREHEVLVAAIAAGDPVAARGAAATHMRNAAQRILQADPAFWAQEGHRLAQDLVGAER
ncbi:FadR/GntR family transcriptional regulator [Xenophilus arseniciresistens]|uniref:FadR/GntR family transcriptional regulator n=1 Tax=Xenophilus arseniciresistens TaxID=1283306 RepID=A0AAE3N7X1_9BURK|nr:FadR/GntR family transcriptional regulator [Xenophilus arseniciresistens]MDA7417675.1 FadR/GntR family transcriptional regulator [Xenophilus arseniciresistens]